MPIVNNSDALFVFGYRLEVSILMWSFKNRIRLYIFKYRIISNVISCPSSIQNIRYSHFHLYKSRHLNRPVSYRLRRNQKSGK